MGTYVEDYIRLQQIRLHKRLDLSIAKHIIDPELTISPLLLIVLVENAFKHGIEPAEGSCSLRLHLETLEEELIFVCENSYEEAEPSKKKGIGLDNLRRRLELIYPGRHAFEVHDDGRRYTAILKIDLA